MTPLTRRTLLRQGAAAAAGLLIGVTGSACTPWRATSASAPAGDPLAARRRLVPVHVAPERVIRVVAGLRPFRPAGFVVRAEPLDDRVLVHNYGHGGGGLSLCWGSSALAVEHALATEHRRAAVLGCGAMGLTTARLLQDSGCDVTIYARDLPPDTTSNVAGAQWSPYTVSDAGQTSPAYDAQFERAARLAHRRFQQQVGSGYGVRWIENYVLSSSPPRPQTGPIADLYPAGELLAPGEHPFAAAHVRRFATMFIEPHIFLDALTREFLQRGGRIVVREFHTRAELRALDEPLIMNCTGLGSRTLFGDDALIPIRGQLVVLLPQPAVDYIALAGEFYMMPRSDGIMLGGTRERGDWSTAPDADTTRRIVAGHAAIFDGMRG